MRLKGDPKPLADLDVLASAKAGVYIARRTEANSTGAATARWGGGSGGSSGGVNPLNSMQSIYSLFGCGALDQKEYEATLGRTARMFALLQNCYPVEHSRGNTYAGSNLGTEGSNNRTVGHSATAGQHSQPLTIFTVANVSDMRPARVAVYATGWAAAHQGIPVNMLQLCANGIEACDSCKGSVVAHSDRVGDIQLPSTDSSGMRKVQVGKWIMS
jgi:hypothetical protein